MIRCPPKLYSRRACILLLALLQCSSALAALGGAERPPMFDSAYLVQVFGALLLVFGCLFGLAFLLRRFNSLAVSDRKSIKVLGAVKVGTREKLLLVAAGGQQLLLGVAAGSVRTLYVFDQPLDDVTAVHSGARGDFAPLLKTHAPGKTTS